jgi:3-oxoacyl-[acyl-carrier-protein] synthase II
VSTNGVHRHRVAVTGIGIVSPIGTGVRAFWEATLAGKIGVGALTRFDASAFGSRVAAQIDEFDPAGFVPVKRLRRTDRYAQFSIAGARLALEDAGLSVNGNGDEIGVWIGSALGGLAFAEEQHGDFAQRGAKAVRPLLAISVFVGAGTSNVALEFGLRGPNVANANSCAAGTVALGEAFRAVARGDVRAAVAGGVEAPLSPLVFGSFAVIRAMSTRNDDPVHASRPFDFDRDGFVMSEGAGLLVLERYEDALARDARIYGEIAGFGLTGDAHHMTAPLPEGTSAARAMAEAMREAHVSPGEVELFNAHGSSSQLNDATETRAMKRAFGAAAARIPVTATKGQTGHALGASGAWETALSLLAMYERRVPRIVNLENADPACDLDFVREERTLAPRVVLKNSTGFGGINAALVLRSAQAR